MSSSMGAGPTAAELLAIDSFGVTVRNNSLVAKPLPAAASTQAQASQPVLAFELATQVDPDNEWLFIPSGCDSYDLLSGSIRTDKEGRTLQEAFPSHVTKAPRMKSHQEMLHEILSGGVAAHSTGAATDDLWSDFEHGSHS